MLDLFLKLNESEITESGNFVKSPYYNTDKNLIKIYENLKKIELNHTFESALDNEIYGGLNINDTKKTRLSKEFRSLIKQYLKLKQFEKDENTGMMYELRALREKKITTQYKKKLNEFINKFNNKYKRDENYYANRIIIEDDYYNFTIDDKAFDYPEILDNKRDNIICNFYFQLLHCYNDMMLHEDYAEKKFDLKFPYLDEILENIKENFEKIKIEHPNICIIYLTMLIQRAMRKNESTDKLEKEYVTYLNENMKKFDKSQLYYYYLYLTNYYMLMVKRGNYEYRVKLYEAYYYQEKNNFIFSDDEISPDRFRDIITMAIVCGDTEWAEYFLGNYKKLLDLEKYKDFIELSYAKIYFKQKSYAKSINHLVLIGSRNLANYISSKIIFCKIYYETKDIPAIEFELDNLRKLEQRSKRIDARSKDVVDYFRKYMKQLIKIETLEFLNDKKAKEIAEFSFKEIKKIKYFIPEKVWFLEKFQAKF